MFDLHDACDLIRQRLSQLGEDHEACAREDPDYDECAPFTAEILQWEKALEVVRAASRKEAPHV